MLRLGQKIFIVGDLFEQNMPIGDYGYIIAYERNADNAFDYVIRVPKLNRNFLVPASDIEAMDVLLQKEAEQATKEALIDFALATKNEELFRRVMNGELPEAAPEEKNKEVQSREDFVKQVNLRAWI